MNEKIYTNPCTIILLLLLLSISVPIVLYAETTASITWSDNDGIQEQIYFSSYANGAWANPVQLTKSDSLDYYPSIGKGENGNTWVVWSSNHKDSILLMYTVGSTNGWAEPKTIETGMSSNTAVSIIVDQQNTPWIAWAGFDGNDDDIFWSKWEGDNWTHPKLLSTPNDYPDLLPDLSINSFGIITVQWQRFNGDRYVTDSRSYIDGSWQESLDQKKNLVIQPREKTDLTFYPQIPAFIPDSTKAKMHVRHFRK